MTGGKDLSDLKQRLSARLLDEPGVSGVGLRGNRVVVYLQNPDAAVRERIERIARGVAADAPLLFEVSGPFRKQ